MRNRKAFFSIAIASAAVLLAGTAVMGDSPKGTRSRQVVRQERQVPRQEQAAPPKTCTTEFETATFTVTRGPAFVPCGEGGQCTEIEYQVSGSSIVYALEGSGVFGVSPSGEGTAIGDPCLGVDGFGEGACHEQAIRTFADEGGRFVITLEGQRPASPTSVAVPTEGGFEACEILGLGLEDSRNPDQATQTTETVDFKGCVVEFTRDAETGEVLSARITPDSPANCAPLFAGEGRTLIPQPVNDLEVRLRDERGTSLGKGKFGDGYISTGGDSCTTRVIGGKVYTWGTPCP